MDGWMEERWMVKQMDGKFYDYFYYSGCDYYDYNDYYDYYDYYGSYTSWRVQKLPRRSAFPRQPAR